MSSDECIACAKKLTKRFVKSCAPSFICECGFPLDEDSVRKILGIEIEAPETAPSKPAPWVASADHNCPHCGVGYPSTQKAVWEKGTCYACGGDLSKKSGGPTLEQMHGQIVHGRVVAKVVGGDFDGSIIELFSTAKRDFGRQDIVNQLGEFDGAARISRVHLKIVEDGIKGRRVVDAGSLGGSSPETIHLNTGGEITLAGVLTINIPSPEKQGTGEFVHSRDPLPEPVAPSLSIQELALLPPPPPPQEKKKGPPPPPDFDPLAYEGLPTSSIVARVTEGPMANKTFRIPLPSTIGREDFRESLGEFDGLGMISGEHLKITNVELTGGSHISIEDADSTNGCDPEQVTISTDHLYGPPGIPSGQPSTPMEIAGAITLEFYLSSADIDSGGPESAEAEQPPEAPSLESALAILSDGEESDSDATMCTIEVIDASGNTADSAQLKLDSGLQIGRPELMEWFGDFDGAGSVSRIHLSFESKDDGVWVIKDADSSNGTSPPEAALSPDGSAVELRLADSITLSILLDG